MCQHIRAREIGSMNRLTHIRTRKDRNMEEVPACNALGRSLGNKAARGSDGWLPQLAVENFCRQIVGDVQQSL